MTCESYLIVERGPRWLAELLYCSPEWLVTVLVVAVVGVAGAITYAWGRVDDEAAAAREMADSGGLVAAIALMTTVSARLGLGYWLVVLNGVVIGGGAWYLVRGSALDIVVGWFE